MGRIPFSYPYRQRSKAYIINVLIVLTFHVTDNWKNEFSRWCPQLRVFMYYGSMEERKQFRFDLARGMLSDFDVILTTLVFLI